MLFTDTKSRLENGVMYFKSGDYHNDDRWGIEFASVAYTRVRK